MLTNRSLRSLSRHSLFRRATVRGKRVFAKVRCPKRVGRACRIGLRGHIGKKRVVTTRRNVRVGKGRTKRVVLRIKPKYRKQVAKRKRLLFKQVVRAGTARAVVWKRIRLVRRG